MVVNRWRLEHEWRRLGSKVVLHVALQFHPSVLEPCPHLGDNHTSEYIQNNAAHQADAKHSSENVAGSALTWVSVRLSFCAVLIRSPASKYLFLLKIFSSLLICSVVNFVRTRRCGPSVSASHPLSSTERHSGDAASLSYPEEYPLVSETANSEMEISKRKKEREKGFSLFTG